MSRTLSFPSSAGIDGAPATAAGKSSRDGERIVGAVAPLLGPETPQEKLRNALMILNVGGRPECVPDAQRLVAASIAQLDTERSQLACNLDLARAEIRRLEAAIRAPRPAAIARYAEKLEDGELSDVLICAMTDGSMREYRPRLARGQRFADAEPIPASAASILGSRSQ